jgi:hypothetical protein
LFPPVHAPGSQSTKQQHSTMNKREMFVNDSERIFLEMRQESTSGHPKDLKKTMYVLSLNQGS